MVFTSTLLFKARPHPAATCRKRQVGRFLLSTCCFRHVAIVCTGLYFNAICESDAVDFQVPPTPIVQTAWLRFFESERDACSVFVCCVYVDCHWWTTDCDPAAGAGYLLTYGARCALPVRVVPFTPAVSQSELARFIGWMRCRARETGASKCSTSFVRGLSDDRCWWRWIATAPI